MADQLHELEVDDEAGEGDADDRHPEPQQVRHRLHELIRGDIVSFERQQVLLMRYLHSSLHFAFSCSPVERGLKYQLDSPRRAGSQ